MMEQTRAIQETDKPWGGFIRYTHNQPSTVKVIRVRPGGILSSQYHHHRDELWVALDDGVIAEIDGERLNLRAGEQVFIPRERVHRLSAPSDRWVRVLEVSFGHFDEEDIVRLSDAYGRCP